MVSVYDYAILKVKIYPCLFILIFTFGCHNNAHVRTQKPLQPDEKVISISTILPLGGTSEDYISNEYYSGYERGEFKGVDLGIIGPRVVVSSLRGKTQSETGFYGGVGLLRANENNRSPFGVVLGAQRKKYTNLFGDSPQKIGAVFELNIINKGGPTVQLFPSITTTTNKNKSFYFGAHGILVSGINKIGLADYEVYNSSDEIYPTLNIEEEFKYNSNSLGLGLIIGKETVFNQKSSFQIQIDFSLVNNFFSTNYQPKEKWNSLEYPLVYENGTWILDQKEASPFLSEKSDSYHFIVSGSIGYNFFKPPHHYDQPISPLPHLQKNIFNPETGERLKKVAGFFDPETGEIVTPPNETPYLKEDKFTDRQLIDLAKKNAQEKHIGALWSVFGLTGVPSSAFGSVVGLFTLGQFSDGVLAFPGFILGGMFGATLPSILAKGSSKITNVTYPPEINTKEEEMKYKKKYKSEVGVLRQKSTAIGTLGGFAAFAGFILLLVIG
ncbi:MAG: hypothetical protein ACJZ10_06225 [Candidatus Neomarinimicrobiota bacterium]